MRFVLVLAVCLSLPAFVGCRSVPDLPREKRRVTAYLEQGAYDRDVAAAAAKARRALDASVRGCDRPALVLDIDETALCTWEYQKGMGYGHAGELWHTWLGEARAPAVQPILDLYRHARELGVAVFFVTGRREKSRAATEANLRAAGYAEWAGLYMKADDHREKSVIPFKEGCRRQIAEQGYTIIVNVGDQPSDLAGADSGKTFLLPNPVYEVP